MFQYVSNAGIVFQIGELQVGIDCLCRDLSQLYQDTPIKIREQLNPDILIFTHEHEDHFCAEYVKEAWRKNSKLQIYSTGKVMECLKQMNIPNDNLNQVQDGTIIRIGDMQIQFIETLHEGEQYANVQNVTLLINKEEKRFVITGDAAPTSELFQRISTWSPHIDWLFAPFPYVGIRSTRKLIKENLNIREIFVLHQPRVEADTQNWIANTKKVCELSRDGLPTPAFPETLGERYGLE